MHRGKSTSGSEKATKQPIMQWQTVKEVQLREVDDSDVGGKREATLNGVVLSSHCELTVLGLVRRQKKTQSNGRGSGSWSSEVSLTCRLCECGENFDH
jgi:hypothetical protein